MSHGYDDISILFSMDRNRKTLSFEVLKKYYQRVECFLDQFDVYNGETRPPPETTPSEYDFQVCTFIKLLDKKFIARTFPNKIFNLS